MTQVIPRYLLCELISKALFRQRETFGVGMLLYPKALPEQGQHRQGTSLGAGHCPGCWFSENCPETPTWIIDSESYASKIISEG